MKKILALILSIAVVLSFSGCAKKTKTSAPKVAKTATNVTVSEVQEGTIADTVTYTGEVKSSEAASASAKVSGSAKEIYKDIGDYVNAGDILLKIDDTDYVTQYNQARAAYNQALAQYNSIVNGTAQQSQLQLETALNAAQIEYNNALTNYENQKVLYDNGAISKVAFEAAVTRLDNAKLNLDTAQQNYDLTVDIVLSENKATAQAAVDSASVQLQAAQNALNNTAVSAPISGYIASRNVNKGQTVSPGIELFSIKSAGVVEVQINVTEAVIPYINIGAKAYVTVKAVSEEKMEATVTTASTVKSQQTGMYTVIVCIDDKSVQISDGMFADVEITLSEATQAKVIPAQSLMEDEDGTKYVYTAKKDKAERVNVEIGIVTDEVVEVLSGLNSGDMVVVKGKEYITEKNNEIKIVE